jgi:hypothetical protein
MNATAIVAPPSTMNPIGIVKAGVATVAHSMQSVAESMDNWLTELQSGQHEDIKETPERMCDERSTSYDHASKSARSTQL